jgi:hypothetical protein
MRAIRVVLLAAATLTTVCVVRVAAQAPAQSDGWVVIAVDDYRALRGKAYPSAPVPPPPPVDATLTRIAYDLSLVGDSVTGAAIADIDVLKDGWVDVMIPAGLLVRDARLDGRPVSLIDQPRPHVLLSKRGRSQLTLQIVLPVTPAGSAESVVIPPAPAALVEASFQIPRDGVDVTVANGFVSDHGQNAGASRWTAHGRANEPLTFTWRRRVEDQRATQPLRLRGSVTQLVGLGEDSTQITATVQLEVLQGLARTLSVTVPPGTLINQVAGPLVADWEVTTAGVVRVSFLEPVAGAATITIGAEVPGPKSGVVAVPLVRLPDAERETGGVAVEVLGAGEIVERQPQAMEPADALDLGSIVRGRESPSLVAFRFKPLTGHDARALSVRVSRYATQALVVANVDEARYQVLLTDDGKALVKARYAVRNNHRGLLSVALPSGATLWHTSVAHRPVRPGRSTTGALLVPLEKGRSRDDLPPFAVELVYAAPAAAWADKGTAETVLPALDLPISRTGVELHYSPRFRVTSTSSAFRADVYAEPLSPALRDEENVVAQHVGGNVRPLEEDGDKDGGAALNALVKQFQQASGGRAVNGVLPIDVPFPRFGAVMFLATELTPETHAPVVQLQYQRARRN